MPHITDIDALVSPRIVKVNGAEHAVNPASAIVVKLAQSMTDANRVDVLLRCVSLVAPSLAMEAIEQLTVVQLDAILNVSADAINAVEESDPNGTGPATDTASPA